jgi:hypothetical protein
MVGYSGTPLPTKLGIVEGSRVAFLNAPLGFAGLLHPFADGVAVHERLEPGLDVVVFFSVSRRELEQQVEDLKAAIEPAGALWVAWPKRASKVLTNMTEDVVRQVALPLGLVDNKVAAIDETWSGLKLVVRLSERSRP